MFPKAFQHNPNSISANLKIIEKGIKIMIKSSRTQSKRHPIFLNLCQPSIDTSQTFLLSFVDIKNIKASTTLQESPLLAHKSRDKQSLTVIGTSDLSSHVLSFRRNLKIVCVAFSLPESST